MQATERNDQVEVLVAPRERILRAITEQPAADRLRRVAQAVQRDVEAGNLCLGQELMKFVKQVGLSTTDVEDPGVRLEPIGRNQPFGHRFPAPVVFVSAVTVAPVAVPIVEFILFGFEHALNLVIHHAREIVPLGFLVQRSHEI